MRPINSFLTACILLTGFSCSAGVEALWQIGQIDHDYGELAIAGDYKAYSSHFPADVDFIVGKSNPKQDWPYILPGPADTWAGSKPHVFKIHFQLAEAPAGYSRLTIDFVNTQNTAPPRLSVSVNGTKFEWKLPAGRGAQALTNPKQGGNYSVRQLISPAMLHAGENTIELSAISGSWALFDDVRMETGVADEPVTVDAQPMPFFKQTPDGLYRAVKIAIENIEEPGQSATVQWASKARSGSEKIDLPLGASEAWIKVPDVDQIELTVRTAKHEVQTPVILPPSKKWKVFIVPTVHTDIGYTDLQDRVKVRHAENGLKALDWLKEYPSFKWFSETYWQLDALLQLHPEKKDEAFAFLREKRMGLSGDYANMLTGLCSSEALNRLTLDARNLANQGGFDLNAVVLDDVPSAIGTLPMVLANSGIKYFIEGANKDRAPYSAFDLPMPFYWEGPDGSRVLSAIVRGYGVANRLVSSPRQAAEQLPAFLAQFEKSDYPCDAVLVNGAFSDNRAIQVDLLEAVRKWNEEWDYPKLIFALPGDFFGYVETNASMAIPVLKTDFGGWWEDGAGSSALETTLSRRAEERAVTAEMLHSLAGILAGQEYPKTNFDDVWHNVLFYNEHTWGAAASIRDPDAMQTVKQWEVKGSFAHQSDAESSALLESGMNKLAAMVPPADVVVFNQLAWPRKALVKTTAAAAMQDMETKAIALCQSLPEGGSCFLADNLPSIGYRSYRQAVLKDSPTDAVEISGDRMENEFYRVVLNPKSGGIASIIDKQSGRELVDTNSECDLGELVYVTGGEGTYAIHSDLTNLPAPKFDYHWQSGTAIHSVNGPVFGELTSEAQAENFPKITLRIRLYHGLKQLDLIYELDKTETAKKEAVYLAFPFAVDASRGGLWLEYPDNITEPLKDQHATACRDWYSVQRWLAVSDGDDTVELSPLDTPLVTLGHMTASTWPREISFNRGHVFAYIMNNYWHTNYKAKQGGHFVFRFSIDSKHGAFSKRDALVDGWNMFCPPPSTPGRKEGKSDFSSPTGSLAGIEPAGLPLATIKEAEDKSGFVFRLCDFSGDGGTATLALPAAAKEVFNCNLVETDGQKLQSDAKTLALPIKPFGLVTIKARFGQ